MYNIYLYYLSRRINNIETINDITNIIKNITFFNKKANSDTIINILTDCLSKYKLKENTMTTISILEQNYRSTSGEEDYCCFILWLAIIYSINNNYLSLL